jgi:hypothetical protein
MKKLQTLLSRNPALEPFSVTTGAKRSEPKTARVMRR